MQVTNLFAPSNVGGDGSSNLLLLEPVIPIPKTKLLPLPQILRPTVPFVTTPGPDRTSGLGDISILELFLPEREPWGAWGVGFAAVLPTASDDLLGQGKWQLGPAATVIYNGSKWQLGGVVQNPVSVAGDDDRSDTSALLVQPIVNYRPTEDWYIGLGDQTWTIDWEMDAAATIPVAQQVGHIVKIGKHEYNLSLEFVYTAVDNGALPVPR